MAGAKGKHGDPLKSYIRIGLLLEPLGEVRLAAASKHQTDTLYNSNSEELAVHGFTFPGRNSIWPSHPPCWPQGIFRGGEEVVRIF